MSVEEKGTIQFAEPCGGCGQVWADRRCFGCHHETGTRAATSPAGDLVERLEAAIKLAEGMGVRGKHPSNIYNLAAEAAQALRYQSTGVTEITDEMVERALIAYFPDGTYDLHKQMGDDIQEMVVSHMRAALKAALEVGHD